MKEGESKKKGKKEGKYEQTKRDGRRREEESD